MGVQAPCHRQGQAHRGIDLLKVKEEMEQTVDNELVQKLRGGLQLWTALVIVGLPLVVTVQTWVIIMLLHTKG